MTEPVDFSERFDRGAYRDPEASATSARWLLSHLARSVGRDDLGGTDVLDVGCGVKFTQAILNHDIPIGTYTGVDVHRPMIEVLQAEVTDPRFTYHHFPVRNALYHPDAEPMHPGSDLGVGDQTFDVICLFSVFTHLDPTDSSALLQILRRHVRPDGVLFFTIFLNELTADGLGLADVIAEKAREGLQGVELPQEAVDAALAADRVVEPYIDLRPEVPLTWPMYSREYALELVEASGWGVDEVLDPNPHAQHQVICRPRSPLRRTGGEGEGRS